MCSSCGGWDPCQEVRAPVTASVRAKEPIADQCTGCADTRREPRIATEQVERLHQRSAVLSGLIRPTGGLVKGQRDRSGRQVMSLGAPDKLALDAVPQGSEEGRNPRARLDLSPMPHHLGAQAKRPEVVHVKSGQIEDDGIHWRVNSIIRASATGWSPYRPSRTRRRTPRVVRSQRARPRPDAGARGPSSTSSGAARSPPVRHE